MTTMMAERPLANDAPPELGPAVLGLFQSHAEDNERRGALHPDVVAALRAHNLFGLFIPKALGGRGASPVEALEIIETLSYADAATAWVTFAAATGTGASAYLCDETVAALFGIDKRPVIAGQGIPNGRATRVDGGYRLSGDWSYGSGIKHADYVHTGAIVYENGAPVVTADGPEMRIFVMPAAQVQLGDNWDVLGLRATGSVDYAVRDLFVPEAYTHPTKSHSNKRGNIFALGIMGMGAIGHTAFALGMGRRILDELAALMRQKAAKPGSAAASESFQENFGAAEAKLRAARALAFDTWNEIWASVGRGGAMTTRQITLYRLALNYATSSTGDIAAFAYKAAGGVSLRSGILQRLFRDMHAATQHVTVSPGILRDAGKELAGLAPGQVWGFIGLVDAA